TQSWLISTQRSRAGLKYSAPAELKCGEWDIARKLESDGPRERGARSGEEAGRGLAARLEQAAGESGQRVPWDLPLAGLRASAKGGDALGARGGRNERK